jgi:ABC-2 type transport system permease protein
MKLRRSGIFWITIVLFAFVPVMLGLMVFIARNPGIAAKLGIVGTKANMFGQSNWEGFFNLLIQTIATLGMIGFGFVTSWVFGREYTDRTLKDILALPVRRSSFVVSKFIVVLMWCGLLTAILYVTGLAAGKVINVSGWSERVFSHDTGRFFMTALLTVILCPPVAFFAGYGRGIIAPLGFVIITLVLAQFVAMAGLGSWFPWAIPGVFTVPVGTPGMQLSAASYLILVLTGITGFFATVAWWRFADQH